MSLLYHTSGYVTFPDGFLVNFGYYQSQLDDAMMATTFAKPFPNRCLTVVITQTHANKRTDSGWNYIKTDSVTNKGFTGNAFKVPARTYFLALGY